MTDSASTPLILLRAIETADAKESVDELAKLHDWIPAAIVDRCEMKIVPAHATGDQILAIANATSADLIVLGAEQGHGMADTMRGTVADRVVQHSACPVLAVSGPAVQVPATELVY